MQTTLLDEGKILQQDIVLTEFHDVVNGIHGYKNPEGKFHGLVEFFDQAKATHPYKVAQFKHGVLHGKTLHYETLNEKQVISSSVTYLHGQVIESELYANGHLIECYQNDLTGRKVGNYQCFNSEGNPKEFGFYQDGKKEGLWTTFHPNGTIKSETEYKDGKLHGIEQYFDTTGVCFLYREWQNGIQNGTQTQLVKDYNTIKEIQSTFVNGIESGPYEERISGMLQLSGTLVNGKKEGLFRSYENTILKQRSVFKNDKMNGHCEIIHSDYIEAGTMADNKKEGTWEYINIHTNQLFMRKTFSDGQASSYERLNPKGELLESGLLKGDRPYKELKKYTKEGVQTIKLDAKQSNSTVIFSDTTKTKGLSH